MKSRLKKIETENWKNLLENLKLKKMLFVLECICCLMGRWSWSRGVQKFLSIRISTA